MQYDFTKHIDSPIFKVVAQASKQLGYRSYVIGGYVRDILLCRPSNDIDVVTVGSGITLAKKVASLLPGKKEAKYYGAFGTAMINYKGMEVEFVGARRESYDRNSRKPVVEDASANIKEELKRKVRIAAGGIQSVIWLKSLLIPFKHPILSFQYISHRVLRWTITPLLMILVFFMNLYLASVQEQGLYTLLLIGPILFYLAALVGMFLEARKLRVKALFIPYYFCVMNYAVLAGIWRFFFSEQSAIWEKALRK